MPKRSEASRINVFDARVQAALALPIRIELARRYAKAKDILRWGKVVVPDRFPLPFCEELHGYMVRIRHEPLTSTEAPRFNAKTTIKCFLTPLFQCLEEPDLFDFYLNVQATDKKALAINTSIRGELESNEVILAIYGDMVGEEKWTDQQFVLSNDVVFSAVSAGQSIRGMNYKQRRPNYVLIDDLYDEDDIHNLESTQKKTDWLLGTLYPALAIGRPTCFHLQGTAINAADALERMKKKKDVLSRSFKSIVDESRKVVLWPEGKSFEQLVKMRELMGTIIFNREMQNERQDEKESKVKRAWLKDWEYDPVWLRNEIQAGRKILSGVYIGNDPSIGKDTEADDTGTCLTIETLEPESTRVDYWVEYLSAEKLSLEERKDELDNLGKNQPRDMAVTRCFIEAIAAFDDYATYVVSKTSLPVDRVSFVKNKLANLENKSHHFQNGRVHVNRNIGATSDGRDLKEMLTNQLTSNYPPHDDVRDALLLTLKDNTGLWNYV